LIDNNDSHKFISPNSTGKMPKLLG